MIPRSLLIIEPNALKPIEDEAEPLKSGVSGASSRPSPMRPGSLSALIKLSGRGIQPAMGEKVPGPEIAALLQQEAIALADPDSPEWKDRPLDQLRVISGPGGELILKNEENGPDFTFDSWAELASHLLRGHRSATHTRKTGETDISVTIQLDGTGKSDINTGVPFFDHMLEQIARHGYMDIQISCRGDLEIDEHHTIEDTAITLGEAIGLALGDKRGIGRYGFVVAMDETRSLVAIDLSGRPWCVFEGEFQREKVGGFPTEMTSHFFHSLAMALKATLHVSVRGENDHHQIEACFKGLARCLRQAVDRNEDYLDILPSSKGLL